MKRLFFQLILSVMISACHDANQDQKAQDVTIIEQPTNNCSNSETIGNLNQLDTLAQGCPVK